MRTWGFSSPRVIECNLVICKQMLQPCLREFTQGKTQQGHKAWCYWWLALAFAVDKPHASSLQIKLCNDTAHKCNRTQAGIARLPQKEQPSLQSHNPSSQVASTFLCMALLVSFRHCTIFWVVAIAIADLSKSTILETGLSRFVWSDVGPWGSEHFSALASSQTARTSIHNASCKSMSCSSQPLGWCPTFSSLPPSLSLPPPLHI